MAAAPANSAVSHLTFDYTVLFSLESNSLMYYFLG
jgi:hypothetical protein